MKKLSRKRSKKFVLTLIIATVFFQTSAQMFSELQSARTIGYSKIEINSYYSSLTFHEDGESEGFINDIGIQAAYGVSDNADIRIRYERIWLKDGEIDDGINFFNVGPKFNITKDKVAFSLPLGKSFGENSTKDWQLHPTLLFTIPLAKDMVDLTLSPKYMLVFCSECTDLLAFNLGASFGDLRIWAFRVEYGLIYSINDIDEGHIGQFSLGFSYSFGG